MIEELNLAREKFQFALGGYVTLCSGVQNCTSLQNLPREESLRQMDAELDLLASYESKIHEAKRAIREARNYSLKLTSINLLPSEILLHVFRLVMATRPCQLKYSTRHLGKKLFLMYPDCLAHVCSGWRQIAISSPSLWVHFDLAICKSFHHSAALMDRVRTRAARSGDLPLQLHIAEQETPTSPYEYGHYLHNAIWPIVPRVEDLEFNIGGKLDDFHTSTLKTFLSRCTPQRFKSLAIDSSLRHYDEFIGSMYDPTVAGEDRPKNIDLSMASNDIETSFSHLTTLHLAGIFPKWTSTAYHGLVDLRLTSADTIFCSSIKESELVNILRASPALRILYLELEITDRHLDGTPIAPVVLKDLEVLSVIIDNFWYREDDEPPAEAGKLLRLFAPGSRPLRFTFQTIEYAHDRSFEEVLSFFMRSNIVKFCSQDAYPPLDELLSHARNLDTLVFRGCLHRDRSMDLIAHANQNTMNSLNLPWNSWHMRGCEINLNNLSMIASLYSNRALVLSDCTVYRIPPGSTDEIEVPEEELLTMFPSVRFVGTGEHHILPDLTADWDILD